MVVSDHDSWPSGKGMHGGRGAGPEETCYVGNLDLMDRRERKVTLTLDF